jgi:hypothetical protein
MRLYYMLAELSRLGKWYYYVPYLFNENYVVTVFNIYLIIVK